MKQSDWLKAKRLGLCLAGCAGLLMAWSTAIASEHKPEKAEKTETTICDEMKQEQKTDKKTGTQEMSMEEKINKAKAVAEKETSMDTWAAAFAEKSGLKAHKSTSGLISFVLQEGEGASPAPTDTVTVHYLGTLLDGTKFDSSYDRGEPATFPLNRVIKGWTEGVGEMKPGEKRLLVIPSDLAYGTRGAGGVIKPNSDLIFEVELLSFN